jgi:hypothetical protein
VVLTTDPEHFRGNVNCRRLWIGDECRPHVGVAFGVIPVDIRERDAEPVAPVCLLDEANLVEIGKVISSRPAGDIGPLVEFGISDWALSLEEG